MKNFFTLALCALGVLSMQAQERYLDEVFESVVVTTDVSTRPMSLFYPP